MVKDGDSDSECDPVYLAARLEREIAINRGDNQSLIDASVRKACHRHDNKVDPNELTILMPHYSRKLNVDNYLMHL